MKLNDNIRRLRMEAGLSQEALSERLGVSRQAVCKWEAGSTSPDVSLLPALAGVFGVTIDSLFASSPVPRYGGYRTRRNELFAVYESPDATEEDFARAAAAFSEVILNGEATTEDYVSYGLLHHIRSRRDENIAIRYYRRAIQEGNDRRDADWMLAHTELLHMMVHMGRLEEIRREFEEWVRREPECGWAHVQLSRALEKSGEKDAAYEEIMRAIQLNDDVFARTAAGDLCRELKRYNEAIVHWDRAYELDSSIISCWFSKAEAFVELGRYQEAIDQYRQILGWLEDRGYDMKLEGAYPEKRIREIGEMTEA